VAQQITIDIVAETKKLTEGVNDATKSLDGIEGKLNGVAKAAIAAGSAFVLREGVQFLKGAAEEARDAELTARAAAKAFGEGSAALQKISSDADKFAKILAVDNDELIKLATQLGTYLPPEAQALSVELVALGKDIGALTGIDTESWVKKFAKGMADGELKASDLEKMIPKLNRAVYKQAEALFKAGKAQDALNLLIKEGNKAFGGAAASQVTGAQRLDKAMGDLKETVGTKLLPTIEKLTNLLVKLVEGFTSLPGPVQNLILGLTALVGIGGPLLTFFASAKTALVTLGIVSGEATVATGLLTAAQGALRLALLALPWVAVVAGIVLVIQNWDKIVDVVKKVWEYLEDVVGKMVDAVKDFADDVKNKIADLLNWVKNNWQTIVAIMTGPVGLVVLAIRKNWDEIKEFTSNLLGDVKTIVENIWNSITTWIKAKLGDIVSYVDDGWQSVGQATLNVLGEILGFVSELWTAISEKVSGIINGLKDIVVGIWNTVRDKTVAVFNDIKEVASRIWSNISGFIVGVVRNVVGSFSELYGAMVKIGEDIARGIIAGLFGIKSWFTFNFKQWIDSSILGFIRSYMKISSPSKVMAKIGEQLTQGLYVGMGAPGSPGINLPQINTSGGAVGGVNITINAGVGTDPYALGREVKNALNKYSRISSI
jgi:hypothetical protein